MASILPAAPEAGSLNPSAPDLSVPESSAGIDLESALQTPTPSPNPAPAKTLASNTAKILAVDESRPLPRDLAEPAGIFAAPTKPTPAPLSSNAAPGSIEARFDHLLATVHRNRPLDDLELIRRAWAFCIQQHDGQKRASGEPYIIHPLEVCQILADLKMDSTAIAAGLLHDAVEDTNVTSPEIAKRFNEQVAHIVEGVTKLDKIKFANREDHQAENIRKMLLAMVTDVRVVIIKLADRLHNMRTLGHLKPEKQQRIAKETLDVYAPLAHRLGMGKLRGELEDLAFKYTDPDAYKSVEQEVEVLRGANEDFLATIVATLAGEARRVWHSGPRRIAHQASLQHSAKTRRPEDPRRPGL